MQTRTFIAVLLNELVKRVCIIQPPLMHTAPRSTVCDYRPLAHSARNTFDSVPTASNKSVELMVEHQLHKKTERGLHLHTCHI